MDSFEASSTVTFIQVDYDPALIPSSWTVFSAGIAHNSFFRDHTFHFILLPRSI
jgi:hypothetical protein